jgi:hypothetical protein
MFDSANAAGKGGAQPHGARRLVKRHGSKQPVAPRHHAADLHTRAGKEQEWQKSGKCHSVQPRQPQP